MKVKDRLAAMTVGRASPRAGRVGQTSMLTLRVRPARGDARPTARHYAGRVVRSRIEFTNDSP